MEHTTELVFLLGACCKIKKESKSKRKKVEGKQNGVVCERLEKLARRWLGSISRAFFCLFGLKPLEVCFPVSPFQPE
ncbi:hypothetical protein L6452_13671 [Arctium lappa]|uniref:Uncharacterized protein n=1 Tax=Arctium lappa TaxID=4217 RepID=A0ACB9CIV6_ARCLA|nr:hypothetical protein L6452_13671 [Arctium lappa]